MQHDSDTDPIVSVVVIAYDMDRELPRTLATIRNQIGVDIDEVEVIVVDNGSPEPVHSSVLDGFRCRQLIRLDPAPSSPVEAVNSGLSAASADLIGVFIDGARMLSPGLVAGAVAAASLAQNPVVASLAFHLGDELQMTAQEHGYDQAVEDTLLTSIDWRDDGYSLFTISVLAASSSRGWFGPMGETNSLFLKRADWNRLGGFSTDFVRPGGGLANHDAYRRACELDGVELVVLLGEGTFHQFHGGAATGQKTDRAIWDEYERIRGRPYRPPIARARLIGAVPDAALPHLIRSTEWLRSNAERRSP